ncbi:MAG: hypothetical protein HN392_03685 [Anaerolineae bacterium]|jgi:hypothetical protein|nr:hypothetical protein [Anaerolineae bacterium]MBT7073795.1 hypothetical protein [Anaerolineae bacterium]MBT7782255.1 hypothetical protein [Anaerolineae bacterium]
MSRIINPNSAGKERTKMTRALALAVRELAKTDPSKNDGQLNEARDLAAFIALALEAVAETVEPSVAAWEKRNYWVKADKFRMEWAWAGRLSKEMRTAALEEDWMSVAPIAMQVAMKLQKIKISDKHRMGRPWQGSWGKLA